MLSWTGDDFKLLYDFNEWGYSFSALAKEDEEEETLIIMWSSK